MTRREGLGLGLAVAGHVALFALLSIVWSSAPEPVPTAKPIEVSLVDDVALDQHAPAAPEPPAQSTAPDPGPPADAPPPPKAEEVEPDPTPLKPEPVVQPKPAPPKPKPAPVTPPKPAPPKPKPDAVLPPKPAPKPAPAPKKPVAEAAAKPAKPSPAKAAPAKAAPAKSAAPPSKAVAVTKTTGTGSNAKATKSKATGSLLDDDFRKGLSQTPSKSKAPDAAPGATMNAAAAADIGSAIQRQVQPCANRQVIPGPGASRILVAVRLQLNRDGSLAARPTVSPNHRGVDDDNRIYVDAVDRAAVAAFIGCAPLKGLPLDLYDVPRGWKSFTITYHMPG